MTPSKRFALLASTGASVAKTVYALSERDAFSLDLVITDRPCGAETFAHERGLPLVRLTVPGRQELSDQILAVLREHEIDVVYLFFTRLLAGDILSAYAGRLLNFHPSLLPSSPGKDGFGDSVKSGALWIGTTVHLVDSGMDTGPQLLQSVVATPGRRTDALRHEVFAHQCASLFQVHRWISSGQLNSAESRWETGLPVSGSQGFLPDLDEASLALLEKARALGA